MNQSKLAEHLASDRYSEADCAKLLKKGDGARAAEYLRATDPERARELAIQVLVGANDAAKRAVLRRQGSGLLEVPYRTYDLLLGAVGSDRKSLARPLVEWLELGRDEHLGMLRTHFNDVPLRLRGSALPMNPAYRPRIWALIEPTLGETLEEQIAAVLKHGGWTFKTNAAFHLAEAHGVELTSLGARFIQGGRADVEAHALKPLLELLWRKSPQTFFEQLDSVKNTAGLVAWQVPWMLDFLGPHVQMVEANEERTVVLHADRLVAMVSGKFKRKGRLAIKVHKTNAAAEKDFEKRLTAAEGKLGSSRGDWDGLAATSVRDAAARGRLEALLAASNGDRLDDLEGLLTRGADPNGSFTDQWDKVHSPLGVARSPGAIQRLLEAGARTGLDDALLSLVQRGDSDSDWPYLRQEGCIRLIRGGAHPTKTRRGWTTLHFATSEGLVDVIDALLEAGADPTTPAGGDAKAPGQTPLEVAEDAGRHLAAKRLHI